MALRWLDSFDHYATADITEKYDAVTGSTAPSIVGTARFGPGALQLNDANTQATVLKIFNSQPTWIVGFAFHYVMSGGNKQIFTMIDAATIQFSLYYETGTRRLFANGPFGSALMTAGLSDNTWYYVETKVTIGNAGTYEVRVDGTTVISGSGDTQASGNASADRIRFEAGGSGGTSTARRYDDLYICDGTTGVGTNPCNDFLGDLRVEYLPPNGNGNSSVLVGSDADSTNNYLLVDETSPNDDTDWVQSSVVGDKDTYAMANLTTITGTVFGVQPVMAVRKDDAGARTVGSVVRSGASEVDGPTATPSTTYRYYTDIRTQKPGGGDWDVASVNAMEAGMKVLT